MRHATRVTVRNGAYVLVSLGGVLGLCSYAVLRDRTPEIVTVTEYRYIPGQCVGVDVVAEPVPGVHGVLNRILRRAHRPRGPSAASNGSAVPSLPPLVCTPPEKPVTRRDVPSEANTVPEPGTLALMALAAPLVMRRRG